MASEADTVAAALDPKEWRGFPITDIKRLSHDTKRYRIGLPTANHQTGMTTASCLMVQGMSNDGSKELARPYTPTTLNSQKGFFELVIKTYPQGNVSLYMDNRNVGDTVQIKGPFPKIKIDRNMKKCIGMIAGGTGITPMYQCIQEILNDPADTTKMTLLYGSRTPSDILLKEELDALSLQHPSRLEIIYKVDKSDGAWTGGVGYITATEIESHMPKPSEEHMVFICGPPPFMQVISGQKAKDKSQGPLEGILKDLGYNESMVYKF